MGLWTNIKDALTGGRDTQPPAEPELRLEVTHTPSRRTGPPPGVYDPRHDGGAIPPLAAVPRSNSYERKNGRRGSVVGHEWRTDDGRLMKDWCCGAMQWKRLGIYQVDVVGESFRTSEDLDAVVPGEPASLVPEPENPHGTDPISVRTMSGRAVGYVRASSTKTLRRLAKNDAINVMFWALHRDEHNAPCAVEVMMWRTGACTVRGNVPVHPSL